MKKVILVVGLCLIITHSYAQDLVVTSKGDSIRCQITKVNKSQIYFNYKSGSSNEFTYTVRPLSLVKDYKYAFYGPDYSSFTTEPPAATTTSSSNIAGGTVIATQAGPQVKVKYPDIIVKKNGDSLQCKIKEVTESSITYAFESHNSKEFIAQIDRSQVSSYSYKWYQPSISPTNRSSTFQFHVNLGLGYRTAKGPDDASITYEEHVKGLRLGFAYNAGITFFPTEQFGLGAEFRSHRSSQSTDGVSFSDPYYGIANGTLSEKIKTTFLGPVVKIRTIDAIKKDVFKFGFGLGRLNYENDFSFINVNSKLEGKTLGLLLDFTYDVPINGSVKNFIGFHFSFVGGVIKEMEVSQGSNKQTVKLDEEEYENLARIDFGVGFRFGN